MGQTGQESQREKQEKNFQVRKGALGLSTSNSHELSTRCLGDYYYITMVAMTVPFMDYLLGGMCAA
jgi:hypothetical protein